MADLVARQRARGRADGAGALARSIPDAGADYLDGVLENPALDTRLALLVLRNPALRADQIRRLSADGRLMSAHEIRAAIVTNPSTSSTLASDLLPHLFWRELARVADDNRLRPPLRRRAEQILAGRVSELSAGEMTSLARLGSRPVIRALLGASDARVTSALLTNPRLVEDDVLRICRSRTAKPEVVATVARSERWICRRDVRLTLARNPVLPVAEALHCLAGLPRPDLERLSRERGLRPLIRAAAARRLESRTTEAPASRAALRIGR